MYTKHAHTGKFIPKNPSKYQGDVTNIVYRSSYERKFMNWCDIKSHVLSWGSEEVVVLYISPLDNRQHRYFVDFNITVQTKTGVRKFLIEVKPDRFTKEPVIPKRKSKSFLAEVKQWGVNNAKWKAARRYAEARNWSFILITEKDLGIT
jgi:hypothetical protein